jgi:hypothetical protein
MNGKVSKMLRKTGRTSKAAKRWWNSLTRTERGELRTDYIKFKNIQSHTGQTNVPPTTDVEAS